MDRNDDTDEISMSQLLSISAADVLRLIMAHLTETGFHDSVKTLQKESGVGMAASFMTNWYQQAKIGQWAAILRGLSVLDGVDRTLISDVHSHAILELADLNEWDAAYATFRIFQQQTENFRTVERRLEDLAALRDKDNACSVPADYYGGDKHTKREELGKRLQESIPQQPPQRLPELLQQAIKWQSYTGQLPQIRRHWEGARSKKRKFDLVLGEVDAVASDELTKLLPKKTKSIRNDYATIKFGKKATCESAAFLPDGSGLVTGSSDGLIEIWDLKGQLRSDLPYQEEEEFLGHDNGAAITALAVSNDTTLLASGSTDGSVQIWRIDTGKCLRKIETSVAKSSVSFLSFSPESSHILTASHDGSCREFGLRTARMLKEFTGSSSYLTCCGYATIFLGDDELLAVVSASGDGSVRIWNGRTADVLHVLRPVSIGLRNKLSAAGSSIVTMEQHDKAANVQYPAIHTLMHLHTPPKTMIVVPRGIRAFLVDFRGTVLRTFQDDSTASEAVFVAAAVSASNQWLYVAKDDGSCCVFDVSTGDIDRTIRDFGSVSTSGQLEVSCMLHHPHLDVVAAFSNDKAQKKGKLVLWK